MGERKSIVERAHRIELANLETVVALRQDRDTEVLIRVLQRCRMRVRHLWPVLGRLPETAEVIFCELTNETPDLLPWMPGEPKGALVVVLNEGEVPDVDLLINSTADGVLSRPITPGAVLASVVLACSNFRYHQRLRWRISRLDESLRSMRTVERAKEILMRTRNLGEEEAYRFIRQQAMSRRVPLAVVAQAIIDSHEYLG